MGSPAFSLLSVPSLHIVFTTSTGHTEYVVEALAAFLAARAPKLTVERQLAETAEPADLLRGDVLLLACGTWNTGGTEGQLHPRMSSLLQERAQSSDLQKKPCTFIALGDDRYIYTARAAEHLTQFIAQHNGVLCADPLVIVNEPYGQEERIEKWGEKLLSKVPAPHA